MLRRAMSFYAVARGRNVGIYTTWSRCEEEVRNFKGAKYKKFKTVDEARKFISDTNGESTKPDEKPTSSSNIDYRPKEVAVALGSNLNPKKRTLEQRTTASNAENGDWPASDVDEYFNENDGITNDDLLYALAEVEGYSTTSKKRKEDKLDANQCPTFQSKVWEAIGTKKVAGFDFNLDEDGYIIVYTDGSCINNGGANAHAGFGVYFGREHPLNVGKPVEGRVTNNVGEIQAATHAIKIADFLGIDKLCLNTDSQFLLNSVLNWIPAWKRKLWTLQSGGAVRNVDDFKTLDALLQKKAVDIKWNYVAAHCGIEGNEMADKLAREGSAEHRRLHEKSLCRI